MQLLDDYAQAAATTAHYQPFGGASWAYPTYGVAGESGEVAKKVERILAGDTLDPAARDALTKELGDVLWYVSRVAADLGSSLPEVAGVATFTDITAPERDPANSFELDVARRALRISAAAGEVSERAKKVLRDRGGAVDAASEAAILAALRDLLGELAGLAHALGTTLAAVAADNAEKLASRAARNVLHGDGDYR